MSTQPATVETDDYQVTSSHETAEGMIEALTPKEKSSEVRQLKPIPDKDDEAKRVSEAASELGKRGGKAAAEKRAEEAKEKAKEAAKPDESEDEAAEAKKKLDEEIAQAEPEQKKKLASDRVAEATRAAAQAKREAAAAKLEKERLEARIAALERAPRPEAQPAAQQPKAAPTGDPEPKQDDFEDYAEYVDKRSRWAARQEHRELQRRSAAHYQATQYVNSMVAKADKFSERLAGVSKSDPGFVAKYDEFIGGLSTEIVGLQPTHLMEQGQRPGPLNAIADEIFNSEHARALMTFLSENPDEFQRIAALRTPRELSREMAKLEARLEAAPHGNSAPKPSVSKANPPVRPVTGSPHIADSEPDADRSDNYDQHFSHYNAKERRR